MQTVLIGNRLLTFRFNNRLHRVNKHSTGSQTGWTTGWTTDLTTGCIVQNCKHGLMGHQQAALETRKYAWITRGHSETGKIRARANSGSNLSRVVQWSNARTRFEPQTPGSKRQHAQCDRHPTLQTANTASMEFRSGDGHALQADGTRSQPTHHRNTLINMSIGFILLAAACTWQRSSSSSSCRIQHVIDQQSLSDQLSQQPLSSHSWQNNARPLHCRRLLRCSDENCTFHFRNTTSINQSINLFVN